MFILKTENVIQWCFSLAYLILNCYDSAVCCDRSRVLTESHEDASSRSLVGAKHTHEIPSVGGSLSKTSLVPGPVDMVILRVLSLVRCTQQPPNPRDDRISPLPKTVWWEMMDKSKLFNTKKAVKVRDKGPLYNQPETTHVVPHCQSILA